ncbi:MAG: DNA repair protein RecO [bacterium]|nr:DNA repair protein RecO [bacterium]
MPVEYRTRALVLRTFDQGESDRLVHLYTATQGRVSAIAKGARRSKRRFPGTLEIFSILDVRLVDPPRSSLMRLEGARLARPFETLTHDLGRYALACLFCELLDRLTGEHEANPELFQFAEGVIDVISDEAPDLLLAVLLLTKTLARLGYRPQLLNCSRCASELPASGPPVGFEAREGGAVCRDCCVPEAAEVPLRLLRGIAAGIRTPLRDRKTLGLSIEEARHADALMSRFSRFHVGLEMRSEAFLRFSLDPRRLDAGASPVQNAANCMPRSGGVVAALDPLREADGGT